MKSPSHCLLTLVCAAALLTTGCIMDQVEKTFIPVDNPHAVPLPPLELSKAPLERVFQGKETYQNILAHANRENWRTLPLGERFAHVALKLRQASYAARPLKKGTPEVPSVNFDRMDEREFIELALAVARSLNSREITGSPEELLRMIQAGRYRDGVCDGTSLSRLEIWDEIFHDNEKRGLVFNVTRQMGGIRAMRSQSKLPHETRLIDGHGDEKDHARLIEKGHKEAIAEQKEKWLEANNKDLPLYYLKLNQLAEAGKYIQNGDILALVSECGEALEEVGIAVRIGNGRLCILHMSKAAGRAVVDMPLSDYMVKNQCAGVAVVRPLEAPAF